MVNELYLYRGTKKIAVTHFSQRGDVFGILWGSSTVTLFLSVLRHNYEVPIFVSFCHGLNNFICGRYSVIVNVHQEKKMTGSQGQTSL